MGNSRRNFIKKSALTVTGLSINPGSLFSVSGTPPSDQVNIGLIGCRGRGFDVLQNHLELGGVNCVALCDVDQNVLDQRSADLNENYNQEAKRYKDFRKLLENKDLDAVIIGTPDHWHCLPMVYACQAGLDVYVEKPMANSIEECHLMMEAANKYDRVVQVGQQQRSNQLWADIMNYIHSGKLGKIRKVNCWANFNYGVGQPEKPNQPVPDGVDYDFWLGPAPQREFNPTRFHGSWRMFWDYGGGLMTDWGVHLLDMALWAKEVTSPPREVQSFGRNLSYEDYNHETFDTMTVTFPMDDYVITWQNTAGVQAGPYNKNYGVEFVGDRGIIVADRSEWQVVPAADRGQFNQDQLTAQKYERPDAEQDAHAQNFIECIKTRETPNCPPEIGGNVAKYAHLGNIAARSGAGKLEWDDQQRKFINHPQASNYVVPEYRSPWKLPKLT